MSILVSAYSENHTKPINRLCGQNAEFLSVIVNSMLERVLIHKIHERNSLNPVARLNSKVSIGAQMNRLNLTTTVQESCECHT
jgi:hypothetical protein